MKLRGRVPTAAQPRLATAGAGRRPALRTPLLEPRRAVAHALSGLRAFLPRDRRFSAELRENPCKRDALRGNFGVSSRHKSPANRGKSARRTACMACKRSPVRARLAPLSKSPVLRGFSWFWRGWESSSGYLLDFRGPLPWTTRCVGGSRRPLFRHRRSSPGRPTASRVGLVRRGAETGASRPSSGRGSTSRARTS